MRLVEPARLQWQTQQRALATNTEPSRCGWEPGGLPLAKWLPADRSHRQIAFAQTSARANAERTRLRVMVDSHEPRHGK